METVIGIDIGGTKCAVCLGRAGDETSIIDKELFPTAKTRGPDDTIHELFSVIQRLCKKHELSAKDCAGIGISAGGPLDSEAGLILSPPNLPGWDEVPIVRMFSDEFRIPVYLLNDANACALAEWRYGAGRGTQHMIFLTMGTGMGAGLILNGRLYEGANGFAGEVGHIRVETTGPSGFGKDGSFEGYTSGGGIAQIAVQEILKARQMGVNPGALGELAADEVSTKAVAQAAFDGDSIALRVMEIAGRYLGKGIAILIDAFNPQRIVIGSVFVRAQALLRPHMQAVIEEEAFSKSVQACEIAAAQLGESLGDTAALMLASGAHRKYDR